MLYSEKWTSSFYQALGELFYAVAMADNVVKPVEIQKLKEAVKEYWLDLDEAEDDYGTDAAYQIEIVFDYLMDAEGDAETHFESFKEFYGDHSEKFDDTIKSLIMETAHSIASSFAGKNKSELMLLANLQLLLQKNN
ncbi:MAG: hypothetical protein V7724_12140 [Sediminicola sp.]